MKKLKTITAALLIICSFTACEKQQWELVDAEETRIAGQYTVQMYRETVLDNNANTISKTEHPSYGSVELRMNTNNGADVFSHFTFKGEAIQTAIPQLLIRGGTYCGDFDASANTYHVLYQGDPNKKRIMLGAMCALATAVIYMDYTYNGNELYLYTILTERITGQQTFVEYVLRK